MKIKIKIKKIEILFILTALVGITLSCKLIDKPEEKIIIDEEKYFDFDPNSVIDDIDSGHKDVFMPLSDDKDGDIDINRVWTQSDFFKLIGLFAESELPSTFNEYYLDNLLIEYDCESIGKKPQYFSMMYHQVVMDGENQQRERYVVDVLLEDGEISVLYQLRQPVGSSWGTLDKEKIKIPFEEAVQIANENGGQEYIDKYDENCQIDINLLSSHGNKQFWEVRYLGPDWYSTNDFVEVFVNAETGEAHKNTIFDFY